MGVGTRVETFTRFSRRWLLKYQNSSTAEVGVQQKTAWLFLGGYTKKHRGRSLEDNQEVLITAEWPEDGRTGNIRMKHIKNFQADTLKFALRKKWLTKITFDTRMIHHLTRELIMYLFTNL